MKFLWLDFGKITIFKKQQIIYMAQTEVTATNMRSVRGHILPHCGNDFLGTSLVNNVVGEITNFGKDLGFDKIDNSVREFVSMLTSSILINNQADIFKEKNVTEKTMKCQLIVYLRLFIFLNIVLLILIEYYYLFLFQCMLNSQKNTFKKNIGQYFQGPGTHKDILYCL